MARRTAQAGLTVRRLPRLPRRRRDAHKGDFGSVLILGGSRGMIGAPALAANAALRAGVGLAVIACPERIQLAAASLAPCATSIPLPDSRSGLLDPSRTAATLARMGQFKESGAPSVVAAGMGLGRGDARFDRGWLRLLLKFIAAGVPVVLDADGLNALDPARGSRSIGWDHAGFRRTVLTPHPGEMARLMGVSARDVQANRRAIAVAAAKRMWRPGLIASDRPVVVLKGADTLVTDGQRIFTNRTGNPGMATGGSGDVLSGVIAGFIAQGLPCFEAAVLGVHVHGLAGDLAAGSLGMASLVATDLLDYLPRAIRAVAPR